MRHALRCILVPAIALVAASTEPAHAAVAIEATAMTHQTPIDPETGWPPSLNPIHCLFRKIDFGDDTSFPAPPDCNLPSTAAWVQITKTYDANVHMENCLLGCHSEDWHYHVVITFSDSSTFSMRRDRTVTCCTDGMGHQSCDTSLVVTLETELLCGDQKVHIVKGVTRSGGAAVSRTAQVQTPGAMGPGTPLGGLPDESRQDFADVDSVVFRAGQAAGLDFTEMTGAFPAFPTPPLIFADSILTQPSLPLEALFDPDPIVMPSAPLDSIVIWPVGLPCLTTAGPSDLKVRLINLGTDEESVELVYTDTAGWLTPGSTPSQMIPAGGFVDVAIPMFLGTAGTCDSSAVALTATLSGSPVTMSELVVRAPGDADGDGVGNTCDNCYATFNPGQEDADGDEVGDVCQSVSVPGARAAWLAMVALLMLGTGILALRRRTV